MPRLVVKLAGERLELLTRSHRVSSDRFHEATGWKPLHHVFDVVVAARALRRSGVTGSDKAAEPRPRRAAVARRRRRALDDVFGDVVPDATSDDGGGLRRASVAPAADERDDEISRDVPPHHA